MGKLFTLLVVFAAGFVCALYYVASGDENYQANDKAARIVNAINHYACDAYHKVSEKVEKIETNNSNSSKDSYDTDYYEDNYASARQSAPYDSY